MSRHSIILSGLAVASFLALGTAPGRADADVDGADHAKLNHGVLGKAPPGAAQAAPAASQQASLDADVTGTDHSKLNHGVLGAASAVASAQTAAAAAPVAPPAPATWAAPAK